MDEFLGVSISNPSSPPPQLVSVPRGDDFFENVILPPYDAVNCFSKHLRRLLGPQWVQKHRELLLGRRYALYLNEIVQHLAEHYYSRDYAVKTWILGWVQPINMFAQVMHHVGELSRRELLLLLDARKEPQSPPLAPAPTTTTEDEQEYQPFHWIPFFDCEEKEISS